MIIAGISSADNNSLALAGPGAAGFGLMKIQKSGSNCLNLGTTSSTCSGFIFAPDPNTLTSMFGLSALSSNNKSNIGEVPILPLLNIAILTTIISQ